MGYKHGIYINEAQTALVAPVNVENIIVAVGTAPVNLAKNPAPVNEPVLAYTYNEAVERLGYSNDFEKYTLCEVMNTAFSLYNVAPVVFINVLDLTKHVSSKEIEIENASEADLQFTGELDATSFKITTGEKIAPTQLVSGTDFEVEEIAYDDSDSDNIIQAATNLKILDMSKLVDNTIHLTYRKKNEALGGRATTTEITLSDSTTPLPTDTLIESVTVETGGVDNLTEFVNGTDFEVEYDGQAASITIKTNATFIDNKIKITYNEVDTSAVSAADIIGGVNPATGLSTGIELIDAVFPKYGLVAGSLIAPKYSEEATVAAALLAKAKSVSRMFPAMAVVDLSTESKTYQAAVEAKGNSNLSDAHLIACWPQVISGGVKYHLSTHVAGLMAQIDAANNDLPYRSPSNQILSIDGAVLADGTEIYLTQDQANLLNQNGLVTVLAFGGVKCWGNENSVGSGADIKDRFISTRRMLNYLENTFTLTFLSRLDYPLNRRQIDTVVNSANIWLNGLTSAEAILGASISLSADMTVADVVDGNLKFDLNWASPPPAKSITVTFTYDTNYLSALLA